MTSFYYDRVMPRDLFNEAKLLKSLGRLTMLINDGFRVCQMRCEYTGGPFEIGQSIDGELRVQNIKFFVGNSRPLLFKTKFNSKDNYPLVLEWDAVDYEVFDKAGNYTQEFIDACKKIKKYAKAK